ncbi:MAG: carboxypeptidase-like regulatory domain-containing protein [Bacteroidota bacterium]
MKKWFLICVFLFGYWGMAQAKGSVSGTVWDAEMQDNPLLFADVHLKGTSWSTKTNFRGNFEFNNIPEGDYILAIDFLGYETREIQIRVAKNSPVRIHERLNAKSMPGLSSEVDGVVQTPDPKTVQGTQGLRK